ncbi:unnamed protein product [Staurois parvus]|uniref:G-protein coupled receptors family 1 profile domain-containing protein n=1 Tax=Staurois parvus TaxID=386267 RepID=A0ABN9DNS7_9NEOB|nr:unnamed protein product [Staurois parvus]
MQANNCTAVNELVIVGFQNLHEFRIPFFCFLLLTYFVTYLENALLIILVITSVSLQTPKYVLLSLLSLCEILYVTNLIPKMLHDIIVEGGIITLFGCIAQLNIFGTLGSVECLLFALMSYDRYVAICKPLRYSALINNWLCLYLGIAFWIMSFMFVLIVSILLGRLEYCGSNIINHFYCDYGPLLALSHSDIQLTILMTTVISALLTLLPFILIILSYTCILYTIIKIQSSIGRQKAFSTCSSHLLVVTIYYGTLTSIYIIPSGANSTHINKGLSWSKVISLLYIIVIPMLNPLIYSLRNSTIKNAIKRLIHFNKTS